MKKFLEEFKAFALKGNVLDMAVGVIVAGAFGSIVSSLTEDIIMPLLGIILGKIDIAGLALSVPNPTGGDPVVLTYGNFLQNILNFIFVALAVFMIVKAANKAMDAAKKKEEEAPAAPPEPSKEEVLLTEIRDLLAKK